jgi:CheY-like chemotaxis protein
LSSPARCAEGRILITLIRMKLRGNVDSQHSSIKRILLVEDDELFRKSLLTFIGIMGYEAVVATSAEEALAKEEKEPVDLVLTDYNLLRMNGIDMVRTLRSTGRKIPAILISGFLSDEVQKMASDARIDVVLKKPADLLKLRDLLPGLLSPIA